ncbi:hypothetical protein NEMIN01_0846 [Nematocida minor]|uniref:uncharacterized protein n=1 Tax=Nematocida minor TaxID=1912983 RepID=UPI00221F430C|nr:uncharacterized protein NEMIN01_0846 [Nematocida minor]KAI5190061.1 hypothetical protein NEMIN01_0846 [Nematocida minor]
MESTHRVKDIAKTVYENVSQFAKKGCEMGSEIFESSKEPIGNFLTEGQQICQNLLSAANETVIKPGVKSIVETAEKIKEEAPETINQANCLYGNLFSAIKDILYFHWRNPMFCVLEILIGIVIYIIYKLLRFIRKNY